MQAAESVVPLPEISGAVERAVPTFPELRPDCRSSLPDVLLAESAASCHELDAWNRWRL